MAAMPGKYVCPGGELLLARNLEGRIPWSGSACRGLKGKRHGVVKPPARRQGASLLVPLEADQMPRSPEVQARSAPMSPVVEAGRMPPYHRSQSLHDRIALDLHLPSRLITVVAAKLHEGLRIRDILLPPHIGFERIMGHHTRRAAANILPKASLLYIS
ncbi:hypothetical protein B0A49_07171 [Cryomyces minteri]|uniref:Uncharacterized protein n=1 Tax=Cryomyces minteri TaxID=331657 RepID=A0A4U0X7V9_9PEZI|nr:hypothetical protein B0A49_07171 [Cryomyces minteri]